MDANILFPIIVKRVHALENGPASESLRNHGQKYRYIYGLSLENIRLIARDYQNHHELAEILWSKDVREFKILATCIEDPNKVDISQLKRWTEAVNDIELAEQLVINLLSKLHKLSPYLEFISNQTNPFSEKIFAHLLAWVAKKPQGVNLDLFKKYLPLLLEKLEGELFVGRSVAFAFRSVLCINQEMYDFVEHLLELHEKLNTPASNLFYEEIKWSMDPEFVRFVL